MDLIDGVDAGSEEELQSRGMLLTKVANHGVCVVWHDGRAYALDDRCPHLGFPLHRGSVEDGLLTCHWHHARFDLCSGGTLDPFADDVRAYPVEIRSGRVIVLSPPAPDPTPALLARLDEGLEQGLTLVTAKAVLGLLEAGAAPTEAVRRGVAFGTTHRREGWGAGLTVLVAMANLLPLLDPGDRALALVQGLSFLAGDTRGHVDRFALPPLATAAVEPERLAGWYRRFIDTRTDEAAERALATAIALGEGQRGATEGFMFAAATDHVFVDGGHTADFTNKAFEALDHLGWEAAESVLPTLVAQTAAASRSEEQGSWRHPHDLAGLARSAAQRLSEQGDVLLKGAGVSDDEVVALAWRLLGAESQADRASEEDPADAVDGLLEGLANGFTPEQAGRAVALAAGLRITRFHVQNDHGDWDVVHHGFTYANAIGRTVAGGGAWRVEGVPRPFPQCPGRPVGAWNE
jgi:nitrite reductase/ring-hydroxylating ferredoxin subunit